MRDKLGGGGEGELFVSLFCFSLPYTFLQESNLHDSNLHVNIQGLVDEDPGDVGGGGGKLKGIGMEGNFTTPNLGNLPHIPNFETSINSNVP